MLYYIIKIVVSALLILAISEIAKRHSGFAALVASIPLTSLLAFIWLHLESVPSERIADLSMQIFWLAVPSLVLFLTFSFTIRQGMSFWTSLAISVAATTCGYLLFIPLLRRFGVSL
jgi:predicted neutral ceramidase superfamily lipid hydrolase